MSMVFKCSECDGEVRMVSKNKFICTKCGRERIIAENCETVDMSDNAGLQVIME